MAGRKAPAPEVCRFLQARASLNPGRSPGGGSPIVVEMIQALPMGVVYSIFELFRQRYMAADGTPGTLDVQDWLILFIVFLLKE